MVDGGILAGRRVFRYTSCASFISGYGFFE